MVPGLSDVQRQKQEGKYSYIYVRCAKCHVTVYYTSVKVAGQ